MPTTFYLDYEGGNDANDGQSFANRWKTITSGATAARIAPGDTIRIMGSPAPTSLGMTATWTDRDTSAAATNGTTMSITSSTNATPIVITRASHGLATGDTIVISGHTTNTNANGTWEVNVLTSSTFELTGSTGNGVGGTTGTFRSVTNQVVRLNSALTANISSWKNRGEGRVAWTASANVTCTLNTSDFKCGDSSDSIAVAAGFTTGLAAYFDTGTLDLSGYQQVSFWIKQTSGTLGAASAVSLGLYANTGGGSLQHTINIPALVALNNWIPVTINLATNLNASIDSIGFIVNTDNGAQTFLINNVIAVKAASSADSLSHTSLIGKNTAGETWYGLQSINGTRVMLGNHNNGIPTSTAIKGYSGTTETVTTYKRETIKTNMVSAFSTTVHDPQDSGTDENLITFDGGWNRTDMSTQDGETWWDGQNGFGYSVYTGTKSFLKFNKLSLVRYYQGFSTNTAGVGNQYTNGSCNNNNAIGLAASDRGIIATFDDVFACNNGAAGIAGSISVGRLLIGTAVANNNGTHGADIAAFETVIDSLVANNNGYGSLHAGLSFSGAAINCLVKSLTANDNWGAAIVSISGGINKVESGSSSGSQQGVSILEQSGTLHVKDFAIAEATPVAVYNGTFGNGGRVQFENFNDTPDDHRTYLDYGLIRNDTSVRHTASGYAWSLAPLALSQCIDRYPLILPLAKVVVVANVLVTVKAWMRRTNTGLTMRLKCRGGQVAGVSSDVTTNMTAAADTWEELTITFTPTEAGAVDITAEAYGGTTYTGYVDDLTITQAGQPTVAQLTTLDYVYQGGPYCVGAGGGSSGGKVIGG